MPITFSSFGDIVVVLQLAGQLRAALSQASGASAEIRALISDVDSFTRALQHTKASIERRPTPLPPDVDNGIKHAIFACHDVLRLALRKVDVFRTRMTRAVSISAWRQYWRVAAWSILGGKKDVDALRSRLLEQLNVVEIYLSLSQMNDQAAVLHEIERQKTTLERVHSVVQDIQLRFDVGVPKFQFYDVKTGQYFRPFARTSLERISRLTQERPLEFYVAHPPPDYDPRARYLQWEDPEKVPYIETRSFWMPKVSKKRVTRWVVFRIECLHYRDRASDQGIVLLGVSHDQRSPRDPTRAITALLEKSSRYGAHFGALSTEHVSEIKRRVSLRTVWPDSWPSFRVTPFIGQRATHISTFDRVESNISKSGKFLQSPPGGDKIEHGRPDPVSPVSDPDSFIWLTKSSKPDDALVGIWSWLSSCRQPAVFVWAASNLDRVISDRLGSRQNWASQD